MLIYIQYINIYKKWRKKKKKNNLLINYRNFGNLEDNQLKYHKLEVENWMYLNYTQQSQKEVDQEQYQLINYGKKLLINFNSQLHVYTSASFTLRNHYQKLLLQFEQKYFFGKEDGYIYEDEMSSNRKKPRIGGYEEENQQASYVVEPEDRIHQQEFSGQPLATLLNQQYQKQDKSDSLFFIKKSKMVAQASEVKRIMLAFESKIDDELTFAINNLLLYSCNYTQSFLLEQYPQLLETITTYIEETIGLIGYLQKSVQFKQCIQTIPYQQMENMPGYQPKMNVTVMNNINKNCNAVDNYNFHPSMFDKDVTPSELIKSKKYIDLIQNTYDKKSDVKHLEKLRTLFVALRNLVMIRSNEQGFVKNERLIIIIYQIVITGVDADLLKSSLEILSILTKHIHLKQCPFLEQFLIKIFEILNGESYEDIGLVTEMLRNLIAIQDNENIIENYISEYLDKLAKLLVYQNQDIREIVLEFLCYLTDLKMATRLTIAKHSKILQRLVAILSVGKGKGNEKQNEKHVKLAAISLNNISQAPAAKQYLILYEKELFLVAASDETVTPLLSQILYELSIME